MTSDDADDFPVAWGSLGSRTQSRPYPGGAVVGMALCGALLIGDLAPEIAAGDFDKCSICLELLDEIRRTRTERE